MELQNIPYRIHPLARIIAYKLYVLHVNDDPRERLELDEISKLFSVAVSKNLLRSALSVLRTGGYVTRTGNGVEGYTFRITHNGLLLIQDAMRKRDSDVAHFHRYQDDALEDLAGPNSTWMTDEDRLDEDAWQPLQIDRSDPEYIEVLATVEEAIERIRGDNGFAENYSEQRNGIVAVLEDGYDWLKK